MIDPSIRLRRALHLDDLVLVKRIISNNPHILQNPDFADNGNTSLHLAAQLGLLEIAEFLIDAGHEASGISRNVDFETPLHLAVESPSPAAACDSIPALHFHAKQERCRCHHASGSNLARFPSSDHSRPRFSRCRISSRPATAATLTGTLDHLSNDPGFAASQRSGRQHGPSLRVCIRAAEVHTGLAAARINDSRTVTECLHTFAEKLDELGTLLQRMYENCDPHVFYHRIRPFLAGSKNMADAGLPNGVIYEDGSGQEPYRQYGGGSNAQSSLIQFFDLILGVEHRPTGDKRGESSESRQGGTAPPSRHNFIHDMRSYMPGPHRRFLEHVSNVANIREYVESHKSNRALSVAFDACLAMLRALRDKHIQMVSRYIIVKSRESRPLMPTAGSAPTINLASATTDAIKDAKLDSRAGGKKLRGTGGTALLPFLKQARDETGEPAIDAWARRILSNGPAKGGTSFAASGKMREHAGSEVEIVGLAGTWTMDDSEGGLCHW